MANLVGNHHRAVTAFGVTRMTMTTMLAWILASVLLVVIVQGFSIRNNNNQPTTSFSSVTTTTTAKTPAVGHFSSVSQNFSRRSSSSSSFITRPFAATIARDGFVVGGGGRQTRLWSEPSDTSSDWDENDENVVVVVEEKSDSQQQQQQQESETVAASTLLDMLPTDVTTQVSDEVRAAINEALCRLEKLGPGRGGGGGVGGSSSPPLTSSPLVNGVWELRYAGGVGFNGVAATTTTNPSALLPNGGSGGGGLLLVLKSIQKLVTSRIPFVRPPLAGAASSSSSGSSGSSTSFLSNWLTAPPPSLVEWLNLQVVIGRSQPRVEASVQFRIAGTDRLMGTVTIVARLDTLSDVRFQETYQSISWTAPSLLGGEENNKNDRGGGEMSTPLNLPEVLQYSRDIYVTYVDDDLLIVRDANGAPEVLVRQAKVFSRNWGYEP